MSRSKRFKFTSNKYSSHIFFNVDNIVQLLKKTLEYVKEFENALVSKQLVF